MNKILLTNLKSILKQRGKSYQWLADELGVSKAQVGHLLSGERKMTKDRLLSISQILNCEIDSFLPSTPVNGALAIELRGEFSGRKSKRSFEKALFAIEDYIALRGEAR